MSAAELVRSSLMLPALLPPPGTEMGLNIPMMRSVSGRLSPPQDPESTSPSQISWWVKKSYFVDLWSFNAFLNLVFFAVVLTDMT